MTGPSDDNFEPWDIPPSRKSWWNRIGAVISEFGCAVVVVSAIFAGFVAVAGLWWTLMGSMSVAALVWSAFVVIDRFFPEDAPKTEAERNQELEAYWNQEFHYPTVWSHSKELLGVLLFCFIYPPLWPLALLQAFILVCALGPFVGIWGDGCSLVGGWMALCLYVRDSYSCAHIRVDDLRRRQAAILARRRERGMRAGPALGLRLHLPSPPSQE